MKRLLHIVLLLAGIVLLAHDFIPHHHHSHGEHCAKETEACTIMVDDILLRFTSGRGEWSAVDYGDTVGLHSPYLVMILGAVLLLPAFGRGDGTLFRYKLYRFSYLSPQLCGIISLRAPPKF